MKVRKNVLFFLTLILSLIVSKLIESNAAEQAYLATNDSDDLIIIHRSRLANQALEKVSSQLPLI